MAAAQKASCEVDNCRCLLAGLAKNLVDRLYGADGPVWGTPFAQVEQLAWRLADILRKGFLDLALSRQADAFLRDLPSPLCRCPSCGTDTLPKDPEPRVLFSAVATVEWLEPHRHCPRCRKAFFPQSRSLGLDLSDYGTSLLDLVCYGGANKSSFREASADLHTLARLSIHEKQVERLCKRIGAERVAQRDGQAERFLQMPLIQRLQEAPAAVTAPEDTQVAVLMADAGMLQLRSAPAGADATAASAAPAEDDPDQERPASGRHWHEDKVGLVMRMKSQPSETDPCPNIPDTFVDAQRVATIVKGLKKSKALRADESSPAGTPPDDPGLAGEEPPRYEGPALHSRQVVASRQGWPSFGILLASSAWLAGFAKASRKAFVADGAKAIWGVWRAHFSSYTPILDFIHAMSYVYEAARAVGQETGKGWQLYAVWITWTWQGQVSQVIQALKQWQQANAEPGKLPGAASPAAVVARTLGYLQNNQQRMKYDEYRQQGLPIVSSLVESMVKQISRRVKGTEKFWTDEGAEAILQLRADYLSDGDVMAQFWQRRQAAATGQRSYRTRS